MLSLSLHRLARFTEKCEGKQKLRYNDDVITKSDFNETQMQSVKPKFQHIYEVLSKSTQLIRDEKNGQTQKRT